MRYQQYRLSISTFGVGLLTAISAFFQEDTTEMIWMIIGGCLAMLFGAFKYWIATQTDRYAVDILAELKPTKVDRKLTK
jgi:hypothetical protein